MEPVNITCEVIGMRKEFTVHKDYDLNYTAVFEVRPIYTIFVKTPDNYPNLAIRLDDSNGPCGSGYCMASWGYMDVYIFNPQESGPFTHVPAYIPVEKLTFEALYVEKDGGVQLRNPENPEADEFSCDVFSWSYDGGDEYYPSGGISVNEKLFKALPRFSERRMVWVFIGESGLGKSTIASPYPYGVFETDEHDTLPEKIYDNVVVVGNRIHYDILRDIFPRIYQEDKPKLIVVNFYQANP